MAIDANALNVDLLPTIFGFLGCRDLLRVRVCKKWKEAATRTFVPPSSEMTMCWGGCLCCPPREREVHQFQVSSSRAYSTLGSLRQALPNLQQIYLGELFREQGESQAICIPFFGPALGHPAESKYVDGEDPDNKKVEETQEFTSYDVSIIKDFKNLQSLIIENAPLNGRYPNLFILRNLRKLSIAYCGYMKWDLDMLSGLPMLETFNCDSNHHVSGNILSLGALKSTLCELVIRNCPGIDGDFMQLADFPQLEKIDLGDPLDRAANVTGDARQIDPSIQFPKLRTLALPRVMERIEHSTIIIPIFYALAKRTGSPCMSQIQLSNDSSDHYEVTTYKDAPFVLELVKAGPRLGWRWTSGCVFGLESCETNWLDPEPDVGSSGYEKYQEEVKTIEESVKFYKGHFKPPTDEEYRKMNNEYSQSAEESTDRLLNAMRGDGIIGDEAPYAEDEETMGLGEDDENAGEESMVEDDVRE